MMVDVVVGDVQNENLPKVDLPEFPVPSGLKTRPPLEITIPAPEQDVVTEFGDSRGPEYTPEAWDILESHGFDAGYVLDQDKDVDLSSEDGAPPMTETDLVGNGHWIEAATVLMPLFKGTLLGSDGDNLSKEEIAQWGLEFMGWFNYNIPAMGYSVHKIESAPNDQKLALYYMMKMYEEKGADWNGAKRLFWGIIADPTTYLGLSTLGLGAFLGASAKQATKDGVKSALKASLPATAIAAIEGAAYGSYDDKQRQNVEIQAGARDEFSLGQNLVSAGFGGAAGGALGTSVALVTPWVKREAGQLFSRKGSDGMPTPGQVRMREARAELKERVRAGEDFTDNPTVDPDEIAEMRRELTLEAEAGQPVDLLPGEGNVTLDDPLSVPPAKRDLGPPAAVEGAVEAGSFPVLPRNPRAPRAIRSIKQLTEDAKITETYREWYEAHRSIMEDIFGEDMQFFNDIVAITSQQASVDVNIQRALQAYQAIKRGEGVENLGLLKGVVSNLKRLIGEAGPATRAQSPRLRAGKPVSTDVVGGETYFAGKKIPDFVEAMRGSDEAVVMDRHMAQLLFNTSEPTMRQVLEGQRVVTIVANNLGWTPKETQAALWAFNQVRKGMDIDDVRDYQKVLTEHETEIRELVAEFGVHRPGRPGGSVPAGGATGDRAVRDQRRADRFTALRKNFGIADDRRPAAGRPDGDVSRGFTRDLGGDVAGELEGLTPVATYRPKAEVRRQFQLENLPAPDIIELDAASSAAGFRQLVEQTKVGNRYGVAVSVLDEADYVGARLFVTADGQAGFALRGDDIVSVFNISGSRYKGVSTSMLQLAVSLGGRRLDAFDTVLPRIYSQAGFSVVARLDFDAKVLRAEGIDVDAFKKTFKDFNNGEPDVVFMVLAPDEVRVYRPGDGGRVKTYEDGIKVQQQALQAGGPFGLPLQAGGP